MNTNIVIHGLQTPQEKCGALFKLLDQFQLLFLSDVQSARSDKKYNKMMEGGEKH